MSQSNLARLRAFWLGGAAALATCGGALAGDLPADDAGTKTIADFVAAYAGKAALSSVKVTAQGSAYLVSLDLGAATSALKATGFAYDPAEIKFKIYQQDDAAWRIEAEDMPPLTGHMTPPNGQGAGKVDVHVEAKDFKHVTVLDPKLDWIASSKGGAEKLTVVESGPGIEEFLEFDKISFDAATSRAADGLTTKVNEPVGALNIVMDIDPKGVNPESGGPSKPTHVSAKGEDAAVTVALNHFQPEPLQNAWKFVVAHPERADYARDFEALKSVVTTLIADRFTLDETFSLGKLSFVTETGPVEVAAAAAGVSVVSNGADSGFSEHFAAQSIKLPEGLVPSVFAEVTPTAIDVGFKATGFDIDAAAQEWFADAKLDGNGPVLGEADRAKVSAKLLRSRPIVVEIQPSHIFGPSLDIAFEGKITIDNAKPSGAVTITVKNFDKTAKAIQALGPEAQQKLVPVIAMAKGLAKQGADGALVWVAELGHDSVMKINGLPLGKAPL